MVLNFSFKNYNGIFLLPSNIIDDYIKESSQDELKVLLYIFRHSNDIIELETAANDLDLEVDSFKKAVNFWVKKGAFKCATEKNSSDVKTTAIKEQSKTKVRVAAQKVMDVEVEYAQSEIAQKISVNPEIKFLLDNVANQFGRPLSQGECSKLIYLIEGAGLPCDEIVLIVAYCISVSKGNIRYITNLALGFSNDGIDSYEKADNKIKELEETKTFESRVCNILGIKGRALTDIETKYIALWKEKSINEELIKTAFDKTVENTGKLSYQYMNKILTSWNEKGIKSNEDAKNEKKRKPKASKSPSFDIDEYVNISMKNLYNE